MVNEQLRGLKALIETKLELEGQNKVETPEYEKNKQDLKMFLDGLSEDRIKYLKKICDQGYKDYVAYSNADIEPSHQKVLDKKVDVVLACTFALSDRMVVKHKKRTNTFHR